MMGEECVASEMADRADCPRHRADTHPVGTRARGNDGRVWAVIETKSGARRWFAVPERGRAASTPRACSRPTGESTRWGRVRTVLTRPADDAECAFLVRFDSGQYEVLSRACDLRDCPMHTADAQFDRPVARGRFSKVFVHKTPRARGREAVGADVLFRLLDEREYLFVGNDIFTFSSPTRVSAFPPPSTVPPPPHLVCDPPDDANAKNITITRDRVPSSHREHRQLFGAAI